MTTFDYGEDRPSPEYEAWLQRREVAEYLEWWRRREAQVDALDATSNKPAWEG